MRSGEQKLSTTDSIITGATALESVTCVCPTDLIRMPRERGRSPVDEPMHSTLPVHARAHSDADAHAGDMISEMSVEIYVLSV